MITDNARRILDMFTGIASNPYRAIREWQASSGREVVGCMGLFVPEEIIHAAGMLPVVVLENDATTARADMHVQNFMCSYIRSVVDQGLRGDFASFAALVISDCCHVVRMLGDLMRNIAVDIKRIEFLYLPVTLRNQRSSSYVLDELRGMVVKMEAISGKPVSEQDIAASIKAYNRNRLLLQSLYQIRRSNPGLLNSVDTINVVKASMVMPKEEHSALLARLLSELVDIEGIPMDNGKVPLIISGSLCETCDVNVLTALESYGGIVVDDDLYVGSRYFNTLVNEEESPIEALAMAYINRVSPCPTRYDPQNDIGTYLADMARGAGAMGVISVIARYCEPHHYSYLAIRRRLATCGIAEYMAETEHGLPALGQVKMRLEAFLESLRGRTEGGYD